MQSLNWILGYYVTDTCSSYLTSEARERAPASSRHPLNPPLTETLRRAHMPFRKRHQSRSTSRCIDVTAHDVTTSNNGEWRHSGPAAMVECTHHATSVHDVSASREETRAPATKQCCLATGVVSSERSGFTSPTTSESSPSRHLIVASTWRHTFDVCIPS